MLLKMGNNDYLRTDYYNKTIPVRITGIVLCKN